MMAHLELLYLQRKLLSVIKLKAKTVMAKNKEEKWNIDLNLKEYALVK